MIWGVLPLFLETPIFHRTSSPPRNWTNVDPEKGSFFFQRKFHLNQPSFPQSKTKDVAGCCVSATFGVKKMNGAPKVSIYATPWFWQWRRYGREIFFQLFHSTTSSSCHTCFCQMLRTQDKLLPFYKKLYAAVRWSVIRVTGSRGYSLVFRGVTFWPNLQWVNNRGLP